MSEENEKQKLIDEIRQRIQILLQSEKLSESEKAAVLREVICIVNEAEK